MYLALVRFDSGMDPVVATKVASCGEGFAAPRTRVGSFSRVGSEVDQQVGWRWKQLWRRLCQIIF